MGEEKSSKINVVLICIIVAIITVIITLFATGTISFNKDNNTNNESGEKDNNEPSDNGKDNEETNDNNNDYDGDYDYWMNYLLAKDDLKVSIHRVRYASDYETVTKDETVVLSIDQVKSLFTKLMNLKLVNRCSPGRGTGDPNYDEILYSYSVNGVKYELSMSGMDYLWPFFEEDKVDKFLIDAFEKSKDAQEGEESEYSSCAYEFDDFKSSLLDEYFK